MPPNNGGRGGKNNGKKLDSALENLRGACPPHKKKDLDKLYKQMNGNEAKIMEVIQLWWEEPAEQEEVWEDVNKKAVKKKHEREKDAARAGRGPGRGGGRGGRSERGGGRAGREGRGPPPKKEQKEKAEIRGEKSEKQESAPAAAPPAAPPASALPTPLAGVPALKGAWGARAAVAATPPAEAPAAAPEVVKKISEETVPVPEPIEVGLPTQNDPMPSGKAPEIVKTAPAAPGGNVWATKGSAHLIRAEKPKPPPAPVAPSAPAPVAPIAPSPVLAPEPAQVSEPTLTTTLPSGAWGKPAPPVEAMPPAPVPAPAPITVSPEKSAPPPPSPAAPSNVLNMGRWDDGGESQQLDFGFGSFGTDADAGTADASKAAVSPAGPTETALANTVSPARPPPGLSLGGMPAMPEGAVMVSDLENKMESASLGARKQNENRPMQPAPAQTTPAPGMPGAAPVQQNYNQYGMPGMYNYNAAAGNGFMGMTPGGPMLAGGIVPGQPGKPEGAQPATGGLYGAQQPAAGPMSGSGPDSSTDNANASAPGPTPGAGIPPGMPGAMPYANPAIAHYGQPQYYMGQPPQGQIGYNFGYGQFGGVAQGGFGYQQVMGQNQGYGGPHYDDHSQQNSHQSGGSGGYHKNTGGYRGRNNNHYQNQYNPQHGGYGGQAYGMGYQGDQFNQRGGYGGPGGMGAPYAMQQQQQGGFQQHDDHQRGKKGGRGFQQGAPQGLGLQQDQSTQSAAPSSGGWSNNQGGGWSGAAAPSWQGNN